MNRLTTSGLGRVCGNPVTEFKPEHNQGSTLVGGRL